MSSRSTAVLPGGNPDDWVPVFLEENEEVISVTPENPPARKRKISATGKRKRRKALRVAEHPDDLRVFVSDADLLSNIERGAVRVHRHGSGEYRGDYLCLRPRGGRRDKRPMLATGRPEKLFEYLAGIGVHLCVSCPSVTVGIVCSQCGGSE